MVRPCAGPISPTPLAPIAETASRRLGKSTSLIRKLDPVPPVLGNASRLVQVLLNPSVNAARTTSTDRANAIAISTVLDHRPGHQRAGAKIRP